jgi:hypothetical protein
VQSFGKIFRLAKLIESGNKAKNPMIANKNQSPLSCLLADKQGYSFSWPPLPQVGLLYSWVIHVYPPYSITLSFEIIRIDKRISIYEVHDRMNIKMQKDGRYI